MLLPTDCLPGPAPFCLHMNQQNTISHMQKPFISVNLYDAAGNAIQLQRTIKSTCMFGMMFYWFMWFMLPYPTYILHPAFAARERLICRAISPDLPRYSSCAADGPYSKPVCAPGLGIGNARNSNGFKGDPTDSEEAPS